MINNIKNYFYLVFMRVGIFFIGLFDGVRRIFYKKAEQLNTNQLRKQTDLLLSEFDKQYRYQEVNDLIPKRSQFKTNILYSIEHLYQEVINATNIVYKKIQFLESNYSSFKSDLDNKLYYELHNLEEKKEYIENEVEELDKEIERFSQEKEKIEEEFGKLQNKEVVGDLHKHPQWFFWVVMIPAGLAEFFIYQNVFLSQELGLEANQPENKQLAYEIMSGVMSVGFIIMIVWMAHALGKFIRYFSTASKKERPYYITKMALISLISAGAIWATVDIRGQMHEIMAINQKVKHLNEKQDHQEGIDALIGEDDEGSLSDDNEELSGDDDDDELDGALDDDDGLEENGDTQESIKNTLSDISSQRDMLEHQAVVAKDATAPVFMLINIFIFIGGVFLSYFVHTSSPIYDMINDELKKLRRRKKALHKELYEIDKEIMLFKKYVINPLFKRMLQEASLYDLHVRTYNAYLEIFFMQVETIMNYLLVTFERFGVAVEKIDYEELVRERITLDDRKELHHVNRIEEYMIYKYAKPQKIKNLKEEQKH